MTSSSRSQHIEYILLVILNMDIKLPLLDDTILATFYTPRRSQHIECILLLKARSAPPFGLVWAIWDFRKRPEWHWRLVPFCSCHLS
jgi:hypothetical protein